MIFWSLLLEPYHPFLSNIFLQGKCSILKPSPSQGCTDGWLQLQLLWQTAKPAGTLPPALSIHLVSWCSSTFSGLCWVCPRTLAKMLRSEWVLLVEWKMGPQNTYTHTDHVFPEMTDDSNQKEHYNSFFLNPQK